MATEQTPLLDDIARMQAVDRRNMLRMTNDIPEQFETAMSIARSHSIEPLEEKPNCVYFSAAGYAAGAASMVVSAFGDGADIPLVIGCGPQLPAYVNEQSMVFVMDYSGRSDTVLRAYRDAVQRGARVVCLTSRGPLMEAAAADGVPVLKVPPGQPERTAVGYLLAPLVVYMDKLGITPGVTETLSFAIKHMKNVRELFRAEYPSARNLAKQIALALHGKLPVIYGAVGYRSHVAESWRRLLNADSKVLASVGSFPDVAFNDISGWELAESQCKDFAVVFLRDSGDKGTMAESMDAVKEILSRYTLVDVDLKGTTAAERIFYGNYLGRYVSCYLAMLNGVDPSRSEFVSLIEAKLAGEPPAETEPQPAEASQTPQE